MSETTMKELSPAFLDKLVGRPLPFKASYHGSSTIIVDADGRWVTQQVPQDQADQIAISMTAYLQGDNAREENPETLDRQQKLIREFKARYHEMADRISFLQDKIEACKPVILDLASGSNCSCLRSDAQKLLKNWPSDGLYSLFNTDVLLKRLQAIVPQPPNAITWEQGVEILNLVQSAVWSDKPL